MPVHPAVAGRFIELEGISSIGDAYRTPAGLARMQRFHTWEISPALPDVEIRHIQVPGSHGPVPLRIYAPPIGPDSARPCLIWMHGGGFAGGDLDMAEADWTSREICARAEAVVVSVDYRLAVGDVSYPVPHDDAVHAVAWAREQAEELRVDPSRITVGGASAGANLSVGAVLRLRDRDGWTPAGIIFVYGLAHPVTPPPSRALAAALAELPPLFAPNPRADTDSSWMVVNYLGGPLSLADGYAMPALAVLDGLCPTLVLNAEYDDLRASGEAFTAALALAGVDVRQTLVPGMMHGFLSVPAEVEPVGRCLDLMARTVRSNGHLTAARTV